MVRSLVTACGLAKTYVRGTERVQALRDVSLTLRTGELVGLAGPSGSGKSTLLNALCGWEIPDSGAVEHAAGTEPASLGWAELALVPQALGLLDDLTIAENVALPARIARIPGDFGTQLMARFGIDHLARRYPNQVSLGEQQRCALARALSLRPALVLADEPTAHQDAGWTEVLFATMRELASDGGAFLIATHNPDTWRHCDRVLSMHDGGLHLAGRL